MVKIWLSQVSHVRFLGSFFFWLGGFCLLGVVKFDDNLLILNMMF